MTENLISNFLKIHHKANDILCGAKQIEINVKSIVEFKIFRREDDERLRKKQILLSDSDFYLNN